ncbi:MAG TPA: M56 family metallopeptidase [Polyangiaceae bacterium]|nr:M56 family metallopeptidase [Polyangiaceae bacterium]
MSVEALLSALGVGVVLAWLALPAFALLARQSRGAPPAVYHRALGLALALGASVLMLPVLRAFWVASGAAPALAPSAFAPLRVIGSWMTPFIGASDRVWLTSPASRAFSAIALLWLVAVGIGLIQLANAFSRLRRAHAGAARADGRVRRRAELIAGQLGIRTPRVLVSAGSSLPFSMGCWAPTVVLPASAVEAAERDLEFMLRHELAHIARGDTRVAFVVSLTSVAFAWHPTARQLAREIAFAREASVDAQVAATGALEYARFLVRALESARAEGGLSSPAVVSMADSALERRIDMLVSKSRQRFSSARTWVSLSASALAVVTLVSVAPSSWGDDGGGDKTGRLAPDIIRSVVRQNYGRFRACYEQLPEMVPTWATMKFTIGEDGTVTEGTVDAEISQLGECIRRGMFAIAFPAPEGGVVTVVYPLVFEPG